MSKKRRTHNKRKTVRAQLRSLKAIRRRKKWLEIKRRGLIGVSQRKRTYYQDKKTALHIQAPKIFSVRKKPNQLFKFLAQIKSAKDNPRVSSVFLVLDGCTYMSNGAIAMMISAIADLKIHEISSAGSYPEDPITRKILEKSGFFSFARGNVSEENKISLNTILQQGVASVDANAVAPLVLKAMDFIFGQPYRNPRIQSLLIELMANTINHAFAKTKNSKWYLSVNFDDVERKVSFTFIDNGQGILNTLNLKFRTLIKSLLLNSNESILTAAFNGEFGSRTLERKRGRGLPNVKKCLKENYIRNLTVITNDVYLDFQNNETKKLKETFEGTCYYWELDLNCIAWKIL